MDYLAELQDCVDEHLTPKFFEGVKDTRRELSPRIFGDLIFGRKAKLTDKPECYWKEISDKNPQFVMPVVKPCDDFDYIETSSQYTQRSSTFPYMQLGNSIDCSFLFNVGPFESPDGDRTRGEAIQDAFIEGNELVDESLINLKEMWASQAFIFGEYEVRGGSSFKDYKLTFPSCQTLNETLSGEYCWGKNKCNNPFDEMSMMNGRMFKKGLGSSTTHIFMNQWTCDRLAESPFFKECLSSPFGNVFLPGVVNSDLLSKEMKAPYFGAVKAYDARMQGAPNVQIWCVESFFEYTNPLTGKKECIGEIPDGRVIGVDLRGGRGSYNAGFNHGAITNLNALPNLKRDQYARASVSENGKSMKYTLESSFLAVVGCPDARWVLDVCKP